MTSSDDVIILVNFLLFFVYIIIHFFIKIDLEIIY